MRYRYGIVGHQAVAARHQLQPQLALAQARFARDQHAHAQDVHEHAMHGRAVGEMLGQVGTQHIDHEGRLLARGEHGNVGALAHGQQRLGRRLAIGQHQHGRLQRDDACHAALAVLRRGVGQIGDLTLAQHLQPVGMDVVQVADEIGARARRAHGHLVEAALRGPQARHPLPAQAGAELLEKDVGADGTGSHGKAREKGKTKV